MDEQSPSEGQNVSSNPGASDSYADPFPSTELGQKVKEALTMVIDPELGLNIVEMGLIYGVEISEEKVHIRLTLTSPGCPTAGFIQMEAKSKIESVSGIKACEIELVWEPPWSPEKIPPETREKLDFLGMPSG